ncbi:MAG: exodeoxyribonuclease VII large subunit [Verrucomicrobiota bacterium]|nr:exodeoxyribonuclease VII large subunit [Verrucomicrobiota bacterium]
MKILTVAELTFAIKNLLEPQFRSLAVKGEISNCKLQSSGHLYFTLKDSTAQLSAVLFRGNSTGLTRQPKEGDQVIATGELSLYPPRGQYQMIVRELQFAGVGELLLRFQKLKELLQSRGWFAAERKRAIPRLPRRIGVVTSPTGAVIQDIIQVLGRRFAGFQLVLRPVKVQGEGAAEEIAQGIEEFNAWGGVDVLIVGRGGGSIEDLWAFNEEKVAAAIFGSKIPIISAVGHETDVTIADWVADVRAPTPSAAAEMVIAEKTQLLKQVFITGQQVRARTAEKREREQSRLSAIRRHPLFSSPYTLLFQPIQQLDHFRSSFERLKPMNRLAEWKKKLSPLGDQTFLIVKQQIQQKREKLRWIQEHLTSLHPHNLLRKGYAIPFFENTRSIILSVNDLKVSQPFTLELCDGRVTATVTDVKNG